MSLEFLGPHPDNPKQKPTAPLQYLLQPPRMEKHTIGLMFLSEIISNVDTPIVQLLPLVFSVNTLVR